MHLELRTSARVGLFCLLSITGSVACGSGDNNPDSSSDVTAPTDVTMTDDAAHETGTDASVDAPSDGSAPAEPTPTIVATSATGHDRLFGVAYDTAGNFYAVGVVADGTEATADFRTQVLKFNAAGQRDMTFGTNGVASHNIAAGTNGEVSRGIVVQASGKIVVASTVEHAGAADARDRDIALVRFNANGSLDTTFGTNGVVTLDLSTGEVDGTSYVADTAWGLSQYADGRLLVTGASKRTGATDTDFAVVRLSVDGVRDAAFGTNGLVTVDVSNRSASPRTATILADNSVVVAGYMNDGGVVKPVIFKLTPAGGLDPAFGTAGIFTQTVLMAVTEAYAAVAQGTSFVTAGYGRNSASENIDWLSLRVTANGQLDTTYGEMGVARLDYMGFADNARTLVALADNRMLLVGGGRTGEMNSDAMIGLLTPDGQRVSTFGTNGLRTFDLGGASDFFWGAAVSPSGSHVAIVGTKAVTAGMGNDDGAVLLLPVPR